MGKNSKIGWTTHTFNPWWGCVKVSEACRDCYAELWAKRTGHDVWGPGSLRRFFGDAHWRDPLAWNQAAVEAGDHPHVFCASMADVFEANPVLDAERERLWDLIEQTYQLRWLLLTKRPENIGRFSRWGRSGKWPKNVWLGTTVENQRWAETRLSYLLEHDVPVRFISAEPLLGPLNLEKFPEVNWIIAGGESGPTARPTPPSWFRDLRDYAASQHIPYHFKQWGAWAPADTPHNRKTVRTIEVRDGDSLIPMIGLGAALSGRILDGLLHDGVPQICQNP